MQEMQSELDAARAELKRQSSDLELSAIELERLHGRLKAAEGPSQFVYNRSLLFRQVPVPL